MIETHPSYDPNFEKNFLKFSILKGGFLTDTADKIIMGTFPPPKTKLISQGEDYFFYPSNRNQFWNIIDIVNDDRNLSIEKLKFTSKSLETFSSNIQRKASFSLQQKWAFLDFFSKVERRFPDSSKDINLTDKGNIIGDKTLYQYLNLNSKIRQISCTYQTAFTNLIKCLQKEKFEIIDVAKNERLLLYQDRKILINLLPPPTRSRIKLTDRVLEYTNFLYN